MSFPLKTLLRPRYAFLVIVAGAATGILLERLIVTDAERVQAVLDDARRFALEGRWEDAIGLLDPDYEFEGVTREDMRRNIRDTMHGKPLSHFEYMTREVEVLEGGLAKAEVSIYCRGIPGMDKEVLVALHFLLDFKRREDAGWVVIKVKMIQ